MMSLSNRAAWSGIVMACLACGHGAFAAEADTKEQACYIVQVGSSLLRVNAKDDVDEQQAKPGDTLGVFNDSATSDQAVPTSDQVKLDATGNFTDALVKQLENLGSKAGDKPRLAVLTPTGKAGSAGNKPGFPFVIARGGKRDEAKSQCQALISGGSQKDTDQKNTAGVPALPRECREAYALVPAGERGPYTPWVLFNSKGQVCFTSGLLRQRDHINFGLVINRNEPLQPNAHLEDEGCTAPTAAPNVYVGNDGVFTALAKQNSKGSSALGPKADSLSLQRLGSGIECAAPKVDVTLTLAQRASPPPDVKSDATPPADVVVKHTLNLYDRYTATLHLGILNSKLHKTNYQLQTLNGSTTIVNKEPTERGPEYSFMVVLQALPRYFLDGLAYPGRDLLHDQGIADRVGLVMSFGLKNPGDRFGLGLSIELARGLNVVAMHEWFKHDRLSGVKDGDTFAGSASDIPTRQTWSQGFAFGLSFDTDYVAKIFK